MSRSEIRDSAFKLIFEQLLRDDDIQELYEIAEEVDEIIVNDEVKKMVDGTLEHVDEIDSIIEKYSQSRKLSRISKLNLAILRLALYECIYDEKTPDSAAISEAVNLANIYSYKEDASFINGLLGAFNRDYKAGDGENA
ncbi:MAG: transcription antitermination factor NusB [Ruminococcus sp.]|nr:transcription antitermination factor NusB [Ruminococcus sp.]